MNIIIKSKRDNKDERVCSNCGQKMKLTAGGGFTCPSCKRRENHTGKVVCPGIEEDAGW